VCGEGQSVVCDGGELRDQVHRDVLVEAAEGRVRAVLEVVEAVQVLPLFGVPQQFIPADTQLRSMSDRRTAVALSCSDRGTPSIITKGSVSSQTSFMKTK